MSSQLDFNAAEVTPRETPFKERVSALLGLIFKAVMNALDVVFGGLQRILGIERMGYVFVLPNLIIFGIFVLFPMLLNFYYALTGGTRLFLSDRPFVGTENFEVLFNCTNYLNPNSCQEDFFWRGVYNTIGFVFFQVGGMVILSMVTALALNQKIFARGFFRSAFFYPVLLSPVVVALIWKWILQRDGLLNALLMAISGQNLLLGIQGLIGVIFTIVLFTVLFNFDAHDMRRTWQAVGVLALILTATLIVIEIFKAQILAVEFERVVWLLNPNSARFWVIFVSIWAQMGFYTLILLAGLQAIPPDLYEAAQIDGASKWNQFRFVTIPMLMPTMLVVLVLSLIRAVQVFDQVFVLTNGGPGSATRYIVQYIYGVGFSGQPQQFGLAAAASVILGVSLLVLTLIQLQLNRDNETA